MNLKADSNAISFVEVLPTWLACSRAAKLFFAAGVHQLRSSFTRPAFCIFL